MEVKKYQISKVKSNNTFNRIVNEIKKINTVFNASLDKSTRILLVECNPDVNDDAYNKELLKNIIKAVHVYEYKAVVTSIDNVEVYRKVVYLRGLDCAYCGSRIENIAKKELNHQKIIVDYPTARFIIETTDKDLVDHLEERITEIAHKVDERIIIQTQEKGRPLEQDIAKSLFTPNFYIFLAGLFIYIIGIIIDPNVVKEYWTSKPFAVVFIGLGYLLIGNEVFIRFIKSIFKGRLLDENFLMTVASICAIFIKKYTEAAVILILYQVGDFLSNLAVNRSRKSIAALLQFDVQTVKMHLGDEIQEVAVEGVVPDDVLVINSGEMIPVDGKICKGKTIVDMKNITGESLLKTCELGDELLSGSLNVGSQIELRVTHTYNNSMMTKIMDLVENSTVNKAKSENNVTNFAKYYTPIVVSIAAVILLFSIIYSIINRSSMWIEGLTIVANFMVIACPCALVISIPLCFFISIGVASKRGILIRGSSYLEAFYHIEKLVFDKTGTLTKGDFNILNVVPLDKYTFTDVLRYFLYTEYYSDHPIGKSIVDHYGRDQFFTEIISDFKALRGGARATINGSKILIANEKLALKEKLTYPEVNNPNLIIYVFKETICIGYIVIGDSIRDEAFQTIAQLRRNGISNIYMLTGDSHLIADDVANKLQIDDVYSELLPDEKVEYMDKIKSSVTRKNGTVCFVGDGVNDAPVISASDVGIAMADTASDVTISISDIVIMSSDLRKLVELCKIARKTKSKITFNMVFTIAVKIVVMFFAISVADADLMPLWLSIFADVGVSLIAVANALLLFATFKKDKKKEVLHE